MYKNRLMWSKDFLIKLADILKKSMLQWIKKNWKDRENANILEHTENLQNSQATFWEI